MIGKGYVLALLIGAAAMRIGGAEAYTLIPVPEYPGSVPGTTMIAGINDSNVIAGSYQAPGKKFNTLHAFFGSLDGNYMSFVYKSSEIDGTEAFGIANDGTIAGAAHIKGADAFLAFIRKPQGKLLTVTQDGTDINGNAVGVTTKGRFVGSYQNGANTVAYLGQGGQWQQDISPFDSVAAEADGINADGVVVGAYEGSDQASHGFVLQDGSPMSIDYPDPNAVSTVLNAINDLGMAVGNWSDFSKPEIHVHAFAYNVGTGVFTPINVKHRVVQAVGVNNAGLVALNTDSGSFVYCPLRAEKCPGGTRHR